MSRSDYDLPEARGFYVTGQDEGALAVERCPWCSGVHLHRDPDTSRPRTCKRTLSRYWLTVVEPPALAELRGR